MRLRDSGCAARYGDAPVRKQSDSTEDGVMQKMNSVFAASRVVKLCLPFFLFSMLLCAAPAEADRGPAPPFERERVQQW
jgi:hypothetical protein